LNINHTELFHRWEGKPILVIGGGPSVLRDLPMLDGWRYEVFGKDALELVEGKLAFAVDGVDIATRDYIAKLAENKAPLSDELNIRRISAAPRSHSFGFHLEQYLLRRGDGRIKDWPSLVANSKDFNEAQDEFNSMRFANSEFQPMTLQEAQESAINYVQESAQPAESAKVLPFQRKGLLSP
jgi:hypothetical protein